MNTKHRATILFDKGLETERRLEFDSFNESVGSNSLSLSIRYEISDGESVSDLKPFTGMTFSTVEITDADGHNVPVFGSYTRVDDAVVNYYCADSIYTVTVTVC